MARKKQGFPYTERAAEARAAHEELHRTFRAVKRRNDEDDPATKAWDAAIRNHYAMLDRALPPYFWDDFGRLRDHDPAGLETAMEFLEADPWFFRSGYIKEDVIRYVKAFSLSRGQVERLRSVVLAAVRGRDRREFRSYCRLARRVDGPDLRSELQRLEQASDVGIARRARWVLDALDGRRSRDEQTIPRPN